MFDNHVYGQPGVYTVTVIVTKPYDIGVQRYLPGHGDRVGPSVNAGPDILGGSGRTGERLRSVHRPRLPR